MSRAPTNGDCASRATINSDRSAASRVQHKQGEKQQRKTRGRHPSVNRERQPRQMSFMKRLDYTSRFVRVTPTLSPNQSSHKSIGHGGRCNTVVTASSSQHSRPTTGPTFTFIRPTNNEELLLHPASFQNYFLATFRCFSVHSSFVSPQGKRRFQPNPLLHFFILVLCCPLLPVGDCGSANKPKVTTYCGSSQ